MPLQVVDRLEAIDIGRGNGHGFTGAPRAIHRAVKLSLPRASVGDPGQRVGMGKLHQLCDKPFSFALMVGVTLQWQRDGGSHSSKKGRPAAAIDGLQIRRRS